MVSECGDGHPTEHRGRHNGVRSIRPSLLRPQEAHGSAAPRLIHKWPDRRENLIFHLSRHCRTPTSVTNMSSSNCPSDPAAPVTDPGSFDPEASTRALATTLTWPGATCITLNVVDSTERDTPQVVLFLECVDAEGTTSVEFLDAGHPNAPLRLRNPDAKFSRRQAYITEAALGVLAAAGFQSLAWSALSSATDRSARLTARKLPPRRVQQGDNETAWVDFDEVTGVLKSRASKYSTQRPT